MKTEKELIFNVFPNFLTRYTDISWLSERAILAEKKIAVHRINTIMLNMLPTERMTNESLDKVIDETLNNCATHLRKQRKIALILTNLYLLEISIKEKVQKDVSDIGRESRPLYSIPTTAPSIVEVITIQCVVHIYHNFNCFTYIINILSKISALTEITNL